MATNQNQALALKNYAKLSDADAADVEWIANSVLAIWPRPELSPEAKLYWTDDIALLFRNFGKATLQKAIDEFRQAADKRPSVSNLRSRCAEMRGSQKTISPEMQDYHRQLAQHPEDFVPLAFIVRDVMARVQRKIDGKPMTEDEKRKQENASWKEWREMVRSGKHKEPMQVSLSGLMDRKAKAAGE